jgi:hypothetical protein
MGKYVFVYTDGGGMAESEPDMQAIMAAWGAWFESLGAAVGVHEHVLAHGSLQESVHFGESRITLPDRGDVK